MEFNLIKLIPIAGSSNGTWQTLKKGRQTIFFAVAEDFIMNPKCFLILLKREVRVQSFKQLALFLVL